jgi:hypothetical protein
MEDNVFDMEQLTLDLSRTSRIRVAGAFPAPEKQPLLPSALFFLWDLLSPMASPLSKGLFHRAIIESGRHSALFLANL